MEFTAALRVERLVVTVRGKDPEASFRTVMTLVEEGVPLVEVSLSGTAALEVIERARRALGEEAWLGAGTVLTAEDAQRAADAGANLLATPGLGRGVAESVRQGLPVLAGVSTAGEVAEAGRAGAAALKLFPGSVGGPAYLRALRAPFPELVFVPVAAAGADPAGAAEYLESGATAVSVGAPLVGDAADGGDLHELRRRAAEFRASLRAVC
ncbi:bifunctional 4-hydroxy-2-oxoglutarate aldolase/2-dehydro-3-deoxy-phosphogluconate aldolase [Streptomyces sp. NPDC089919]|uniref:bifunctional 4-hydroxy-2-oxoglutarate aldolase/2-dehydro-3-deoxy-phosphogluconate aldolase n=1 Tax=Streptomyces sp. NPDC089919 TaxID=3155188 RepID=UPI00341B08E5